MKLCTCVRSHLNNAVKPPALCVSISLFIILWWPFPSSKRRPPCSERNGCVPCKIPACSSWMMPITICVCWENSRKSTYIDMARTGQTDASGECSIAAGTQDGRHWSLANASFGDRIVIRLPDRVFCRIKRSGSRTLMLMGSWILFRVLQTILHRRPWALQIHVGCRWEMNSFNINEQRNYVYFVQQMLLQLQDLIA